MFKCLVFSSSPWQGPSLHGLTASGFSPWHWSPMRHVTSLLSIPSPQVTEHWRRAQTIHFGFPRSASTVRPDLWFSDTLQRWGEASPSHGPASAFGLDSVGVWLNIIATKLWILQKRRDQNLKPSKYKATRGGKPFLSSEKFFFSPKYCDYNVTKQHKQSQALIADQSCFHFMLNADFVHLAVVGIEETLVASFSCRDPSLAV